MFVAYVAGEGRWALWLVCACYLVVVYITSRGLIAAPRYRLLQARLHGCRVRAGVCAARAAPDGADTAVRAAVLKAVTDRLDRLERNGQVAWRLLPRRWVVAIPLSKLASAWRVLHEAEAQLLRLEDLEETALRARALRLRLEDGRDPADEGLARELAAPTGDPAAGRAALIAVTERLAEREDGAFEREYELQRIALWLALIGLGAVLLIGRSSTTGSRSSWAAWAGSCPRWSGSCARSGPPPGASSSWRRSAGPWRHPAGCCWYGCSPTPN
ncbi:hypothetical protein EDD96_6032 [Streptomyces sp. Ag109_G2-6]|uniref:hypothetical protein n=2 Tax=Streptomyces TaxID=1883 RepID=UPI000F4F86D4|nr:hypothetical protein [Streptomyces sp. Ag109_G2-6]RPF29508.1 hypothetical protein EDD96_6032 [Streptomyces sp. Ag109_G2-6]